MTSRLRFEHETYTEQDDGDFIDEPWEPRASTHTTHEVSHAFTVVENPDYHDLTTLVDVVKKIEYYLVYAVYTTGDSFGTDYGRNLEFLELFEDEKDARDFAVVVRATRDIDDVDEVPRIEFRGVTYHIPWCGVFENLSDVVVLPVWLE